MENTKELKVGMLVKRTGTTSSDWTQGYYYPIKSCSLNTACVTSMDNRQMEYFINSDEFFDFANPIDKPDPFKDWLLSLQASAHGNENTDVLNTINIILNEYEKTR